MARFSSANCWLTEANRCRKVSGSWIRLEGAVHGHAESAAVGAGATLVSTVIDKDGCIKQARGRK